MNNSLLKSKNFFILCFTIISLSILVRLHFIESHFAHIDDIGVADTLLTAKNVLNSYTFESFQKVYKNDFFDQNHPHYRTLHFKIGRILSKNGLLVLDQFYSYALFKLTFWSMISQNWNYAPLQFYLSRFLVDKKFSYERNLFGGRLPSTLFSILALFLFIYFYLTQNTSDDEKYVKIIFGLFFLGLSWETIIYSMQMSNYAVGPSMVFTLLIILQKTFKNQPQKISVWILIGLSVGTLISGHYQVLFFIPAFYATIGIFYLAQKKLNLNNLKLIGIASVATILMFLPLYYNFLKIRMNMGINGWNAGPNGMFVFYIENISGIKNLFFYVINFFLENSMYVFGSSFSFVSESYSNIIGVILFVFFIFGLLIYALSKNEEKRFQFIFILISLVTFLGLFWVRKLAYSPTRHCVILIPIFLMPILETIYFVLAKLKLNFKITLTSIITILVTLFTASVDSVMEPRKDQFNEVALLKVIEDQKVDLIFQYDYTMNLFFMKSIADKYFILPVSYFFTAEQLNSVAQNNTKNKAERIAFVSHRSPITQETFNSLTKVVDIKQYGSKMEIEKDLSKYKLIYSGNIVNPTEIEYKTITYNGSNNLYLEVFELQKNN